MSKRRPISKLDRQQASELSKSLSKGHKFKRVAKLPKQGKGFKRIPKINTNQRLDIEGQQDTKMKPFDQEAFNFDEKGFNQTKCFQSAQRVLNLFQQIENFSLCPQSKCLGFSWGDLCRQIRKYSNEQVYLIRKIQNYYIISKSLGILQITQQDSIIWKTILTITQKMKLGLSSPGLQGLVSDEISQASKIIQRVKNQVEESSNNFFIEQIEKLYQQYLEILAQKTFQKNFSLGNIDQLNYFRFKQYEQGHCPFYQPITSQQQWKIFIGKRRNKLRKSDQHLLHTACQSCFSPYFQSSNQIIACKECRYRYHQLCLDCRNVNRCGRCIYLRLPKQMKQQIPECFICGASGLGTLKVATNKFAHVFCLMAHQLWTIRGKNIEFTKELFIEEEKAACKICLKSTNFSLSCELCNSSFHASCAYLNGIQFSTQFGQTIIIRCCEISQQNRKNNEKNRKFVLNYQKCVFAKLGLRKSTKKNEKSDSDEDY